MSDVYTGLATAVGASEKVLEYMYRQSTGGVCVGGGPSF